MPFFSYSAKSLQGEEKSGEIEAKNLRQLSQALRSQGFILIKAVPVGEEIKKGKLKISFPFFGSVSLTDKLMFTRNLQVMIGAGLPLPKALETLALQAKSKNFKSALLEIKEEIIKGKSFSESLAKHPNIFSELFQNMIKVGEETGGLDNVLKILAKQMERENELKSKVQGALMYPMVIIITMIGIGIMMLIMVVPKLSDTFKELEIELPFTTKLVMGMGNFLAEKWFLALFFLFGIVVLLSFVLKTKGGKKIIDTILLKTPVISSLIKKTNSAATVRTLSSLIASGVPIVKSLEIVSGTLGNVYYKAAVLEAVEKVKKGEKLSVAFQPYTNLYSPIVFQMIQVGEETGETSAVLEKLADFFEEEVGNATKNMAAVIEPILMLIIGGAIGFFAISMVQPMYSMLEAI